MTHMMKHEMMHMTMYMMMHIIMDMMMHMTVHMMMNMMMHMMMHMMMYMMMNMMMYIMMMMMMMPNVMKCQMSMLIYDSKQKRSERTIVPRTVIFILGFATKKRMLEVLPFVEDPDLSGSAAPALSQLLPPCCRDII